MKTTTKEIIIVIVVILTSWNTTTCQTITNLSNGLRVLRTGSDYYMVTDADTNYIIPDIILVKYVPDVDGNDISDLESEYSLSNRISLSTGWKIYSVPVAVEFIGLLEDLLAENIVFKVEVNFLMELYSPPPQSPNDPFYQNGDLWYLDHLNMLDAWEIESGNNSVTVADLDTGYDWDVTDFGPDNQLGYDFIDQNTNTYPQNCYHGTGTAGIIAAKTNNGTQTCGIAGGWNTISHQPVKIMMLVVGDCQGVQYALCCQAMEYALAQNVRVYNFSFGHTTSQNPPNADAFKDYIDYAYSVGAVMFASSGNTCPKDECQELPLSDLTISWPASDEHVIGIGGTSETDYHWFDGLGGGASWGPDLDLSAPAKDIMVYNPMLFSYPYWNTVSGTSLSSAMSAGVAALMLSLNPCLSNVDIEYILKETATKIVGPNCWGYDYYWNEEKPGHCLKLGYGLINAHDALHMAGSPATTITSNETWTDPKWFIGDITIPSGITLTIQSTIKMSEGNRIIVEKGGHLILDGGTVTTTCQNYWEGVEAEGDPNLSQTPPSNQGYVTVQNGAIIEKAFAGIKTCVPTPSESGDSFLITSGGGIINADNSSFINCAVGVNFGPYPYNSASTFTSCSFITDDNYYANQNPSSNAILNGVTAVRFKQCFFTNSSSLNFRGIGISTLNSNFYVDGQCSTQEDPCPLNDYLPSEFTNLRYGIYSVNNGTSTYFYVKHSSFTGNYRGIYASATDYCKIENNSFELPTVLDASAYGLYFENSTGYSIEGNTFTGDANQNSSEVGLYIRNSGLNQNWVHNNTFSELYCGTIADGINRDALHKIGLCYKCNDFSVNYDDIFITADDTPPVSANHGIAQFQGYYYSGDTMPAGNTFSTNCNYNIENLLSYIQYNYHEINATQEKIIPNPITSQTVGLTSVPNTTYSKEYSCPSWMNSNTQENIQEYMSLINIINDSIEATRQQIDFLTDGGNTDGLNSSILYGSIDSSFQIYQDIMAHAPFLSDTVMQSAIYKETVFPDVMIRDILIANPQSAKSNKISSQLDSRIAPLSDEMLAEIYEGVNINGGKDLLEMKLSKFESAKKVVNDKMLKHFLYDTSLVSRSDSIRQFYCYDGTMLSRFALAMSYLESGQTANANVTLDNIPNEFTLSNQESALLLDYCELADIYSTYPELLVSGSNIDSLNLVRLMSLAANNINLPNIYARNTLMAYDKLIFEEPVNLPASNPCEKSKVVYGGIKNPDRLANLKVIPNPVEDYCIIDYEVPVSSKPIFLSISNLTGYLLMKQQLIRQKDEIIVNCAHLIPGEYIVAITIDQKTIATGLLIKR